MMEEKTEEQVKEELKKKEQKRVGQTEIMSVSVSKEFSDLVKIHELSPTEVFRRGVAVMMHDIGVQRYKSPLNEKRSAYVKEMLEKIDNDEKLEEEFEKIDLFFKIKKHFAAIRKIVEEIQ